ncbi:major facilitator superfamily domain-containing protein [Naematelia encephala]|uniref:Major facilitator superfamily domain-containing protein n=1 Tax=Naematelia encephala TaxID=71784 RepID=A0A1Y2ALL7_9TREE|nr:major facilitator superfamily domain-containing protein [Naematelia encephala]
MALQLQISNGADIELSPAVVPVSNQEPAIGSSSENAVDSPAPSSGDSNRQAVIICIACFTIVFTACGTLFAFGVYQELYEQLAKESGTPFTGASPAAIDLIGTLAVSFMTIGAPYSTAWAKLFSPSAVAGTGGALFGLACVLASFSVRLWQFELTQGLLLGIATCLSYMPAVTVAPTWYGPRRGLAMGIILSGTGVGGLVWAPAITALVNAVGYRNTLRISGAVSAVMMMLAASVLRWDSKTAERLRVERNGRSGPWHKSVWNVPLINWRIARTRTFVVQLLGTTVQAAAYYTPVFFFSTYARTLGFSTTAGANFIAVNNACNAIGKILVGIIADRCGRLNTLFVVTMLSSVVSCGLWLPSSLCNQVAVGRGLFITYSVTYGIFASPYVSLFPTSLVELFGPANFASVNGALYMARGLGTLVGTPTAGVLIRSSLDTVSPEAYWRMVLLVTALLGAAAAAALWVRLASKVEGRL